MPLDFIFRRSESRRDRWRELREPHLDPLPSPVAEPEASASATLPADASQPTRRTRFRHLSPRDMAAWAHEMYMLGSMSWDEYRAAIPAEMHPDYDLTIGALTGQPANPDTPRDIMREWEERLDFLRRHRDFAQAERKRAERIVSLLQCEDA